MSRTDNGDSNGQKPSTAIIVAVIGAVAVIVAAVIGALAVRSPSNSSNSSSAEPPSPNGSRASACAPNDRRYETAQLRLNSFATEAGVTPVAAYFFLDRAARPPEINVSGQLDGNIPASMNLWLVSHPKANTVDSTPSHNPGSNRYYPVGGIKPTAKGCWSVPPHSIGYDEALGITFEQVLMFVPNSVQAQFINRPKGGNYDGFDPMLPSEPDIRILGSFDVATSP